MPFDTGDHFGGYEIVAPLGKGGMGEVYRARDTKLGSAVALKVLRATVASDPTELARFEQEARATSALNHPHIVQILDFGSAQHEDEELHYIAMELVEGRSLRELLTGPTQLVEILEILAQVSDALDKAHQKGIVHRDVKPENVIVTEDGYAKVVDFGIAKLTGSSDRHARSLGITLDDAAKTQVGEIMGTLAYMAPEQISSGEIDGRTDVFALGNIIFEAVMGDAPFRRDSAKTTIRAILHDDVPEIRDAVRLAPLSIEKIARRCLAKKPGDRYPSTGDVADHLRGVRREMEVDPTSWIPVERFGIARWVTVAGFSILLLVILVLVVLSWR